VDDLAVGVKVASRAEGTVAAVGWEGLKWKRSFGCVRGRIDGVGVGDAETETVREYELELFAICERFCSAKTGCVQQGDADGGDGETDWCGEQGEDEGERRWYCAAPWPGFCRQTHRRKGRH